MEFGGSGDHLFIDVCGIGNDRLLYDPTTIRKFFDIIIEASGMKAVGALEFFDFPQRKQVVSSDVEDFGGVTAFQILAESHLSIHTYPNIRAFSLDLFSCRGFDTDLVVKLVHTGIDGGIMKNKVVKRSF